MLLFNCCWWYKGNTVVFNIAPPLYIEFSTNTEPDAAQKCISAQIPKCTQYEAPLATRKLNTQIGHDVVSCLQQLNKLTFGACVQLIRLQSKVGVNNSSVEVEAVPPSAAAALRSSAGLVKSESVNLLLSFGEGQFLFYSVYNVFRAHGHKYFNKSLRYCLLKKHLLIYVLLICSF